MDIQATKLELVKQLINVKKASVLKKIKEILLNNERDDTVAYSIKGNPLTKKQFKQELLEAEQEIARGEFISHQDLKREIQTWSK